MNRVIKFRVWDIKNKQMEEVDGYNLYLANNEIYEVYEAGGSNYNPHMNKERVTNKYELMQYIGFTDSKKVEIYEDDIVHIIDTYAPKGSGISNFIGIIKYGNGSFYVSDLDGTYSTYRLMDLDIEVIGNIYENSEMLKENDIK